MRWGALAAIACLGLPATGHSAPEGDSAVAKVGPETIAVEDLQRAMKHLHLRFGDHSPREALQPLIDRKVMKLEAEKKALDENPAVVAALEKARRQLLVEKLYEEEASKKAVVSEEEIRTYFAQHGLDGKREVRASHIAVATREEAWALYQQLRKGADFAELARAVSIDTTTAAKGGDMGYWQEEDIPRSPFVRQLFALKTGEVSEPYQDARGDYHLIEAVAQRPVSFERQRGRIQSLLERQKKDQLWRAYGEEQLELFDFAVDEAALAFLLRQGRRAIALIPPIPPEHYRRVLCRFQGGAVDLETYLEMVRSVGENRRPAPVDSEAVAQFVRLAALRAQILPKIAEERGWQQEGELRSALEKRREEVLVEMLRQTEVEDRVLTEELLRAHYENHRGDFAVPARTFVEGGILASLPEAQTVAARARSGEGLAEIMRSYPMFLGRWRKYDVFNFSPADTARRPGSLHAMIEAVRGAESGETKGPVQIHFERNAVGYVVLQVLEEQPSRFLPLTDPEVREIVRDQLRYEHRQKIEAAFEQYAAALRKEYAPQIVIREQVLDALSPILEEE